MPTHNPHDPNNPNPLGGPDSPDGVESGDFMTLHQQPDPESRKVGYELTDANIPDIAGFLVVLAASVAVVFVLAFGIGKLIYYGINKQDGPPNKWSQMAGVKQGNMESNPQIEQQQLQQLVKRFPSPRLQSDDGNMDVADMHAREDILLNHYTWVDENKQTVRIPIERAMQIVAQKGLPVESQKGPQEQAMFGDRPKNVTAPLTNGFARTGPELQMIEAREQRLGMGPYSEAHAELHRDH
ncbi:MAG TPA: hypothetical protein VE195_08510 [Acidobacteriaceae bacterium]|nr:hypothetical protein [Acidobacteriaceae bacterium]